MRNRTTFGQHIRVVGVEKTFYPFGERVGHHPKACQRDFYFYVVLQNLLSPARDQITGLKSKCYFSLLCGIILGGLADQLLDENSGRCQPATRAVNTNPNVFQLPLRDADVADWLNGFTWFSGMPLTRSCL